jgi:hypothetical protein
MKNYIFTKYILITLFIIFLIIIFRNNSVIENFYFSTFIPTYIDHYNQPSPRSSYYFYSDGYMYPM